MNPSGKKFSRSIVLFLILFMSVSMVSTASITFFIYSHNARKDSHARFEMRTLELTKMLASNMERLKQLSISYASNPLVINYFISGDADSLIRYINEQKFRANGVSVTVIGKNSGQFIPDLSQTLPGIEPYLQTSGQLDTDEIKFNRIGKHTITFFSSPIMDMSAEIGTCFLIYDISEDSILKRLLEGMGGKDSHFVFHDGEGNLFDVATGEHIPLQKNVEIGSDSETPQPLSPELLPGEMLFAIDNFPGMYYATSIEPVLRADRAFLIVLVYMCVAILCLICVASILLSRMVTKPLEIMAAEAFKTAEAPTDRFLREDRTDYIEIRQMAHAFNQVLANLLDLQQKFKLKAKKELDASEERFRLTVEAAPDSITINSLEDGRFIQVNETFVKISGYAREEAIGKSNKELNLYVNPSDLDHLASEIREKGVVNGSEIAYRRKDGTIIHTVVSARKMDFEDEACIICVVSDRTAQKNAELEQKKLEAALQRATKMEAIGTMAGGVAHDLNNILSGLVSYPELLLMDLPQDSSMRKAVLTIQKSGQKAAAIVQDMLTLARRGVSVMDVLNINEIASEYLKSPEHQSLLAHCQNVRVRVDLGPGVMNVIGSHVHISKSLMNLVSNAVEAMPEGGEVCISTRNRYIDVPVRRYDTVNEGDYVVLEVSDTGTGIPQEDQEQIFEPFYTKKKMGKSGTGLGMAVVWGTVKDHNGYIDLESRQGVGTTFSLYFPATRSGVSIEKPQMLIEEYSGHGESVLVVDDVETQRNIASGFLNRLGYTVTCMPSGEAALDYLQENTADILVLDMVMEPGMDGLETYRRVLELFPNQKAVIASGYSETDRVREAQSLGAGAYVRKPYLMQNIGLAVRKELDR